MEEKKGKQVSVSVYNTPIAKSDISTIIDSDESSSEWITPPLSQKGLSSIVDDSNILPQCIRAYKKNIAGFGFKIEYNEDVPETPEMAAEYKQVKEKLALLSPEKATKELFEDIIEARETYGIAYIEVIRNRMNEVCNIVFLADVPSIKKSKLQNEYVNYTRYFEGNKITARKKFRKYKQEISGKTVYFKEFGDPRIMDLRTGNYADKSLDFKYRANEIIDFPIGTEPYGKIRWIGQILGADGARRAENLNNNYFRNGRHTPLMICVNGGTLSEQSKTTLQNYMQNIQGESGQHSFIVLQVEDSSEGANFGDQKKPTIEIKDMAGILQKDELFQDYIENTRKRIQSAFLLPDVYTGYTSEYNRATVISAVEVTERQVFVSERNSIEWIINNQLLGGFGFKYTHVEFRAPDITNPEDMEKILNIAQQAGGITPNDGRELLHKVTGKTAEPYKGDWANLPLVYQNIAQTAPQTLDIIKSDKNDEMIAVMKEVRSLLENVSGDSDDEN